MAAKSQGGNCVPPIGRRCGGGASGGLASSRFGQSDPDPNAAFFALMGAWTFKSVAITDPVCTECGKMAAAIQSNKNHIKSLLLRRNPEFAYTQLCDRVLQKRIIFQNPNASTPLTLCANCPVTFVERNQARLLFNITKRCYGSDRYVDPYDELHKYANWRLPALPRSSKLQIEAPNGPMTSEHDLGKLNVQLGETKDALKAAEARAEKAEALVAQLRNRLDEKNVLVKECQNCKTIEKERLQRSHIEKDTTKTYGMERKGLRADDYSDNFPDSEGQIVSSPAQDDLEARKQTITRLKSLLKEAESDKEATEKELREDNNCVESSESVQADLESLTGIASELKSLLAEAESAKVITERHLRENKAAFKSIDAYP